MNQNKVENELRFLKIYAALMTLVCTIAFGSIFKILKDKKFDEIDVERINVVEKDGKLRMVISNQGRQHPGVIDGITFDERKGDRPAGIIFFGEKGDEIGGLVFDGNTGKGQGGSLTFDKFRGDQTIQVIHEEDKSENYFAGLKMNDQNMPMIDSINREKEISKLPTKEAKDSAYQALRDQGLLMTERLKIGRDFDKSSVIKLKDAKGKVRIELKVEANGN
ncbi:MAG TPA: hypothetical protein VN132_09635, partial [Bdellovibrio sp.]|nr:hypothetical protein [Bdellovibrio sp.]